MNRINLNAMLRALLAGGFVLAGATAQAEGSGSGNVNTQVELEPGCFIRNVTNVVFAAVTQSASAPGNAYVANESQIGTVVVECSPMLPYVVTIGPGANGGTANNNNRKMCRVQTGTANCTAANNLVEYRLFSNPGRGADWLVNFPYNQGPTQQSRQYKATFEFYGSLGPVNTFLQNAGKYEDTVGITVSWN